MKLDFISIIILDAFGIIEDVQQMILNGMRIGTLSKYLEQCWIRDEEESRKHNPFAF